MNSGSDRFVFGEELLHMSLLLAMLCCNTLLVAWETQETILH